MNNKQKTTASGGAPLKAVVNKLVTHSGSFHSDDIFATATLQMMLDAKGEKYEVTRTRNEEIIKNADYVYDVGGVYDEATNRFDHHQVGGAGRDENGIEYSSFGLVWKKFGAELCGSADVANIVKNKLVAPIDAADNGMDLVASTSKVFPYFIQFFFYSMVPTWREEELNVDEMFFKSVEMARVVLEREIAHAKDTVIAENSINQIYKNTEDKRILVFDKDYPSAEILQKLPEPIFIIYPRRDKSWGVKAVRKDIKSFENRKNLPKNWTGLKNEELQKVTGVPDAIFCHRALYLAVAKSKEGALKLAEIALNTN